MEQVVICCLFLLSPCFAQDMQKHDHGSKEAVEDPIANQHNAALAMRSLNIAAETYYVAYAAYPASLSAMGKPADDSKDYNKDHAGLLTGPLSCAHQPCPFHNYLFSYKQAAAGYVITARPRKYGVDGKLSLYSDESGMVRGTLEDREATEKDKPVGASY